MWAANPRPSHVINASLLCEEAFHDLAEGVNCACYQLAAHLGLEVAQLDEEMRALWSEQYPEETTFFCLCPHDARLVRGARA